MRVGLRPLPGAAFLFLGLLPLPVGWAARTELPARLRPGRSISGTLRPTQSRAFLVELRAGERLRAVAIQLAADLRMEIHRPGQTQPELVDGFEWGPEFLTVVAATPGDYKLVVSRTAPNGRTIPFELVAEHPAATSPEDALRVRAQQLGTEAKRLAAQGTGAALREARARVFESIDLWRAADVRSAELGATIALGELAYALGDYADARSRFEAALASSRELRDRRSEGAVHSNLGMVELASERPVEALDEMSKALVIWEQDGFSYGLAATLSNRAGLYGQTGEFTAALRDAARALDLIRRVGDARGEAFTHYTLGVSYGWIGDRQKALSHFERSRDLFRKAGEPLRAARSELSCARIELQMGRPRKALELQSRALPDVRSSGDGQWEAEALDGMGKTLAALGDSSGAARFYRQAMDRAREIGYRRGEANVHVDLGHQMAASGDWDGAYQAYTAALRLREEAGLRDGQADAAYHLGALAHSLRRYAEARKWLEQSLATTESLRSLVPGEGDRMAYLAARRERYGLYIDTLMQLHLEDKTAGFDRLAFEAAERGRARVLLDRLGEVPSRIRQGVSADVLQRETALRRALNFESFLLAQTSAVSPQATARRQRVDQLAREYEELDSRIRAESRRYAALTRPEPLGLEEIRREILPQLLLLEYWLESPRSYLFAVTSSGLDTFVLPPRSQIEGEVRLVYSDLVAPPKEAADEERFWTRARRLSRWILGPAARLIVGKTLLIVADGALEKTPFSCLPLPRPGADAVPLIARHEVAHLSSASALVASRRESAGRPRGIRGIAILADPVYDSQDARLGSAAAKGGQRTARFARLVFSRAEADAIAAAAPTGQVDSFVDFAASKATAQSPQLARHRVLHFSAHGILDEAHPELSGVVLSLVNRDGSPRDGFLRLHEIYNLNLAADLVVLNACESGLGRQYAGEGAFSLARAFAYAGAKASVVGFWRLDDAAASSLMRHFYIAMFDPASRSTAGALRQAQVKILDDPRWRHPYYWAAFTLHGEWRK